MRRVGCAARLGRRAGLIFRGIVLGALWSILLIGEAAHADPFGATPGPWVFGDPTGQRTRLYQQGIDLQLVAVTESAYNPVGGLFALGSFTGQVQAGVTFNLERLVGLHDAQFQLTYTTRFGRNLVDDAQLNTLMLVQEVWGRGQTTRLTQFWFNQRYFDGLLDWKVGRTSMGEDFASFACDFQNLTFCGSDPGNIVGNYIFNWPISQWGTRLKANLPNVGYVQAAIYDVNQQSLGYQDKLLPVFYPGSSGVLVPFEIGFLPELGPERLSGSYKFGVWYTNAPANDVAYDVNGSVILITGLPAVQRRGRFGGYVNFEQQLTRNSSDDPKAGVRAFFNAVLSDEATSIIDRQLALGFVYKNPFNWRASDSIALAIGTTHVNQTVNTAQNLVNAAFGPAPIKNTEYVAELYYNFVPVPGLFLRPNIQYVATPSGSSLNRDILILGLKTVVYF